MTYDAKLAQLTDATKTAIAKLWAAVESGALTVDEFVPIAADLVAVANLRGQAVATAAFRAYLEAAYGIPMPVTPTPAIGDAARLRTAMTTIVTTTGLDTLMQLVRLATNEPADAAAKQYGDELSRSRLVEGWRRGLNPDACQLCTWWSREGRVFQRTHPLARHTGCTCHQVPVIANTTNYQTEEQARSTAASNTRRNRSKP